MVLFIIIKFYRIETDSLLIPIMFLCSYIDSGPTHAILLSLPQCYEHFVDIFMFGRDTCKVEILTKNLQSKSKECQKDQSLNLKASARAVGLIKNHFKIECADINKKKKWL